MTTAMKLGRQPRGRNPRVAHLSSILAGANLPSPPASAATGLTPAGLTVAQLEDLMQGIKEAA
jgi:hypothetical protein